MWPRWFFSGGQLFFYRVTPFGAVFSAFWWARLGGLILRIFHHLIWLSHAGFLYVDDFLFFMEANMMPLSATLLYFLPAPGNPYQLEEDGHAFLH